MIMLVTDIICSASQFRILPWSRERWYNITVRRGKITKNVQHEKRRKLAAELEKNAIEKLGRGRGANEKDSRGKISNTEYRPKVYFRKNVRDAKWRQKVWLRPLIMCEIIKMRHFPWRSGSAASLLSQLENHPPCPLHPLTRSPTPTRLAVEAPERGDTATMLRKGRRQ